MRPQAVGELTAEDDPVFARPEVVQPSAAHVFTHAGNVGFPVRPTSAHPNPAHLLAFGQHAFNLP